MKLLWYVWLTICLIAIAFSYAGLLVFANHYGIMSDLYHLLAFCKAALIMFGIVCGVLFCLYLSWLTHRRIKC